MKINYLNSILRVFCQIVTDKLAKEVGRKLRQKNKWLERCIQSGELCIEGKYNVFV